jgi:HTH-type transcriptional regulator/antitoxin HigA
MGLTAISEINEKKYGKLLAKTLPKVIANDEEFDRRVAQLEALSFPERQLSAEEDALANLLERLIADYDDRFSLPEQPPHEMVKFLMEQRGLKQADLVPVLGSRAQVSDLVNGKRGISKAQAKKLAEYFRVSVELFI